MSRPKIAAIVTVYYPRSHADVVVTKFLKGFPTDEGLLPPEVDIVSMYLDQIHERDIGVETAKQHGVPIYTSIPKALTLDGDDLAVDGVLLIGEHGDYAWNEKGQHLYPRKYFFEQISAVIATSRRSIPVFSDKHLSYDWRDAKWMVDRAKSLEIPFMAGSSVPVSYRRPWLEYDVGADIEEAVSVAYANLDSYGFHALELLQCMVERRGAGETGIKAVQCLEGDGVWEGAEQGLYRRDLLNAAVDVMQVRESGRPEDHCEDPGLFLMEYGDGLKTATFILNGFTRGWGFAARRGDQVDAMEVTLHDDPHPHFSYLSLNIQRMFLTGEPSYPVERTLLISGALEALLDSRYQGHVRIETPHLVFSYESYT
ncbi:MAG: hypothetical protein VX910_08065, partial [Candidatus Latescibacterota bacterium]|nr:hypothetical protein [Candidatus Latescibacterota bacterium]